MEVLTIEKVSDLINNIFPKNITIKEYLSETHDLCKDGNKFERQIN